jgi:hypothetical protein
MPPPASRVSRDRRRHPEEGGREDLRRLDARARGVPETEEVNRGVGTEADPRTYPFDLRHHRGAAGPVAQVDENDDATLQRHCEIWEQSLA